MVLILIGLPLHLFLHFSLSFIFLSSQYAISELFLLLFLPLSLFSLLPYLLCCRLEDIRFCHLLDHVPFLLLLRILFLVLLIQELEHLTLDLLVLHSCKHLLVLLHVHLTIQLVLVQILAQLWPHLVILLLLDSHFILSLKDCSPFIVDLYTGYIKPCLLSLFLIGRCLFWGLPNSRVAVGSL